MTTKETTAAKVNHPWSADALLAKAQRYAEDMAVTFTGRLAIRLNLDLRVGVPSPRGAGEDKSYASSGPQIYSRFQNGSEQYCTLEMNGWGSLRASNKTSPPAPTRVRNHTEW
jgi:hypothetical protein